MIKTAKTYKRVVHKLRPMETLILIPQAKGADSFMVCFHGAKESKYKIYLEKARILTYLN